MPDYYETVDETPEELMKKDICPDCGGRLSDGSIICSVLHGKGLRELYELPNRTNKEEIEVCIKNIRQYLSELNILEMKASYDLDTLSILLGVD